MPGRDGTGPMGQGPMTGGARGWCAGDVAGRGRGMGAGMGRGRGGGYGRRNRFYETGLTGAQRAAQADAAPSRSVAEADAFTRIEGTLNEVLTRLERLESAGQK